MNELARALPDKCVVTNLTAEQANLFFNFPIMSSPSMYVVRHYHGPRYGKQCNMVDNFTQLGHDLSEYTIIHGREIFVDE